MSDGMLKAALRLNRRHGWAVFPVVDGKPPVGTHGFKDAASDPTEIRRLFNEHPEANGIAVRCDSQNGPIVLDIDGPDGRAAADALGLPPTLEARTGRGRHLYFAPDGDPIRRAIKVRDQLDVLGDGGYVVVPPSHHAVTGKRYKWLNERDPAPLPRSVRALVNKARATAKTSTNGNGGHGAIGEGERDNTLTSLAGTMRRRGMSEDAILAALLEENARRCVPPLGEQQVRKIARSIGAKPAGDDVEGALTELNETYAVIQVGDKVRVLQERPTLDAATGRERVELTFLAPSDFRLLLADRSILVGDPPRPKPLADQWLTWSGRREYQRVVFAPGAAARPGEYNLWRGWAVGPSAKGSCDRFLAHLRDNVCGGKASRYEWLLDWLAHLVQSPDKKLGTGVVLRGAQGVGKSIVGATVGRLLGPHYVVANSPRYVTGRFNSHLERCLLLHAEEAFWAGDKAAEGVLKDVVTNPTQMIERKGVEPIVVANHLRLLITSNQRWVVPAGFDERRFAVFDVKEDRQQDHAYFAAMHRELDDGGYAKLLHVLLNRRVDETRLRQVPRTAAQQEQIIASLSPEDAWLLDLLTKGRTPGRLTESGEVQVAIGALHRAYCAHARTVGIGHRADETKFGLWLRRWFPGRGGRARSYDPQLRKHAVRRTITLPSLNEARATLGARLGRSKWGAPTRWTIVDEEPF